MRSTVVAFRQARIALIREPVIVQAYYLMPIACNVTAWTSAGVMRQSDSFLPCGAILLTTVQRKKLVYNRNPYNSTN
jgi:hypothetical protein